LRDTGLAGAAGSSDDSRVGGFTVRDGLEDARRVVDSVSRCSTSRETNPARRTRASRIIVA
jgi:hypothetical protein